ncbi:tetratricopeptide repeat protein [Acidicapsa acidisoli]|nr:tetratricopeptide repeat protein [Acidicapsa acidisoli]
MSYVRVFAICPFASAPTLLRRSTRWPTLLPAMLAISLSISIKAQQPSDMAAAREAMEAKNYSAAEKFYRKALAQSPAAEAVLTDLGLSLQMQGRSAEAMHYYSLALKQRYVPETYALLAEEKCRMGELDSLRPMLAKIYHEERKNIRVASAVASCYLDLDEPIESVEIYDELLKSNDYPEDLALVQSAKSYLRSGQFFAAKLSKAHGSEPFLAALREAPTSGSQGARSAFAEAERISPYFRPDLSWSEAVERWRQHPQDVALLYLLSVLSAEQGMQQIERCTDRYSTSPYLAQFQADVLADQGHEEEAVAEYERLIREHPELADLHYSLGLLREKHDEWELASQSFRAELASNPVDERPAAHLSKCMLQLEQYAALRDFLQPLMKTSHPPQWASLNLAEAEQKLGDSATAIRVLTAAEREPNPDKLVHYRLMHLYSISGRTDDAKREYALFQAASSK